MRIAIVNDQEIAIEAIRRAVTPHYNIAWTAKDGAKAAEMCLSDKPDIILMNLIMPVMDGAEATRIIMESTPCAVIIVTSSVSENAARVFDAMGYGALDAAPTPVLNSDNKVIDGEILLQKIATVAKIISNESNTETIFLSKKKSLDINSLPNMIAIGASTGGPKALMQLLGNLPKELNAAVVIVQHVESQFTDGLVVWLDDQTELPVRIAAEGEYPEINTVYIAGGNKHLLITKDYCFRYSAEPRELHYKPSVDVFFESLSYHYPRKGTAVLLTGMGSDGAKGLLALKKAGWHTIAQDKESSIVYGMPRAAAEIGAAQEVLPPAEIAKRIVKLINEV